jgi:hypothetical protein
LKTATGASIGRAQRNTLNQTNLAAFRLKKPWPAKEQRPRAQTYTPALVDTPCGCVCAQSPPSKAQSPNGAKQSLSTLRIATRSWPWRRAYLAERRTSPRNVAARLGGLCSRRSNRLFRSSIAANRIIHNVFAIGVYSKLVGFPISSSVSSIPARSYGGTKRELGVTNSNYALSRFAFSTRTDRSEPIATDSGPIRTMLRTARVTLKGPACFASSERPCALPPPRSRACARLGIPRQCSRADGCNCGGGVTCSWSRRWTHRQPYRRNGPAWR